MLFAIYKTIRLRQDKRTRQ